jgi:signal transduction histidine kinase
VTTKNDEDARLRSVALETASSILAVRQRAELRSEAHLAEAQRLSHTGSFDWRVSTGEIRWSEEIFRIFQYDRTTTPTVEVVLQRVHPEDAARVQQTFEAAALDGKDFDFKHRLVMPDASVKHVHVVAHGVSNEPGGIQFVGAVMDVTGQHQAEAALGAEKRLLEMIARGESRALILEALCRVVEELVGGSLSSILLLDSNANRLRHGAAPSLPTEYAEAIDGVVIGPSVGSCGTAAYRAAPVIVHDIATDPLWAEFRVLALAHGLRACWSTPVLSSQGRVLGTFAIYYREPRSPTPQEHSVLEQITHLASIAIERAEAEETLRQAQADLAHVSRVTTLGEMAASIAHEVDQPLSGVVINANACLRFLSGASPNLDEVRDGLHAIARDGRRASDVIGRIRALARRTATEKEPLDINEVIREVATLAEAEARRARARLRTEFAGNLPRVLGDRVQLQQVVLNLLLNGLEAMHAVVGRPRELVISTHREATDRVRVAVQDSGSGLDPQLANRIFEAFYTTKGAGMGMGLSISRSIVEQHGGRLWAVPNDGPGTTFQFTV